MNIIDTFFGAVRCLEMPRFDDRRGSFIKCYNESEFRRCGMEASFRESYFSISEKNVIRGMHFQIPPADHEKLVSVSFGAVRDVVLDIRKGSPTFGKAAGIILSAENNYALFIPRGFAHGFLSLEDHTIMNYLVTCGHSPEHDKGILWNSFGCDWGVSDPLLSERDRALIPLDEFNSPFIYHGE